jgi:hypothetical protein
MKKIDLPPSLSLSVCVPLLFTRKIKHTKKKAKLDLNKAKASRESKKSSKGERKGCIRTAHREEEEEEDDDDDDEGAVTSEDNDDDDASLWNVERRGEMLSSLLHSESAGAGCVI